MMSNYILGQIKHKALRLSVRQGLYQIALPLFRSRARKIKHPKSNLGLIKNPMSDCWPGKANQGSKILDGDFEFLGKIIHQSDRPWLVQDASDSWIENVAGFDWLDDLRAVGTDTARIKIRELILLWIKTQEFEKQNLAWKPEITGRRLANWLGHREFLSTGADIDFINEFQSSILRQTLFLRQVEKLIGPGFNRIETYKGLILSSLSISNKRLLKKWCKNIDREIAQQILVDGGHISRNPATLLMFLRHLIDIRSALKNSNEDISEIIQHTIDKISPMIRFFRHGDGGLALFNGSDENEGWLIDIILGRSEARGNPINSTPHIGFERLEANRTLLLIDTGNSPPINFDIGSHAGALSFEMSVGKERIITNCGAHIGAIDSWSEVQRTTAAHSTITVEDLNSAELLRKGGIGTRPHSVQAKRQEGDGNVWIDASLTGYGGNKIVNHHRRIYLAANGNDVRGEDKITGKDSQKFIARFHLHPTVRASMVGHADTVLIRTPRGLGWRFKSSGGAVSLQEGVYLGLSGQIKRTEQIVVSSVTKGETGQIRWAISRVDS